LVATVTITSKRRWDRPETEEPPHLYRDDLLEQAQAFLCKDIVYLRLTNADRLFPTC
jgi:hypothetical protein